MPLKLNLLVFTCVCIKEIRLFSVFCRVRWCRAEK